MPARQGQAERYALIPYPPSLGCWPAPAYGSVRRSDSRSQTWCLRANHLACTFVQRNSTNHGLCHCIQVRPIHLRQYVSVRTALHYDGLSDVFFVSEHGGPLHRSALWRWFTTRCRTLGMGATDAGRRPSLSALRHSFAVERMRRWYTEGVDVQARLPHLSVYMGHVRPQESYWYLSATPELLTAAAERFGVYAAEGGIT